MREKCRIDSGPIILNTETYTVIASVEEVDVDEPSCRREFDGVGQQIRDDLSEAKPSSRRGSAGYSENSLANATHSP
jgi:hypothetical protein